MAQNTESLERYNDLNHCVNNIIDATSPSCLNIAMLSDHDKVIIEEIVTRVVDKIVDNRVDRVENKIDKVLKIVTSSNQEHAITKVKVNKLDKRMRKVEKILKIPSSSESVIFT